jgi:DHA3 family tetracycline resistance protein-like MFS transporter
MSVYRVQVMGLDPFQLVFVGTMLEITAFLFEVPTGVVADTYSRRLSIIIGVLMLGAAFALEGLVPLFAVSLLCQVISGIGYTFTSGATEAWITDEIGEENAGRAFLRASQIGQISSVVGTLAGMLLASVHLNLPIVLGGSLFMVLGVFLIFTMPEHGFKPTPHGERTTWQALTGTLREGVKVARGNNLILMMLGIAVIYGAYSEGFDRLWEAHFLKNFTFPSFGAFEPVVWFGIINLGVRLLSLIATEIIRRRVDTNSHVVVARFLMAIYSIMIVGMLAFGLAGSFMIAVTMYTVVSLFRTTGGPLYDAWLNQHVESKVRATVFSIRGQADALGQIAGGPIVGLIATVFSLRAVMVIAGLMLAPTLLLYRRSLRQQPMSVADVEVEVSPVPADR